MNGLIHISQMSDGFVSSPAQVLSVGQTVRVKVLDVDAQRSRVALTMKGITQNGL